MTGTSHLGKPTSRIDGRAKVMGTAKYAAEYNVSRLAHGVVVSSAIAKGRIKRMDTADALAVHGVLDVFTHEHRPKLASSDGKYKDEVAPDGSPFRPLYDDRILFNGQPIALVVAEELEIARFAASLIRVEYEQQAHVTDFEAQRKRAAASKQDDKASYSRGNAAKAFEQAPVRVRAEYRIPVEHHNPMEPFATTAVWEGDGRMTVFDKTQGPQNSRNYVADVCEMPHDNPGAGARRRYRRYPGLVPAQRGRHDLAIRGFPAAFRQLVELALPMRKQRAAPEGRQARPEYALRHACTGRSRRPLCD
jgi:xanthine dehydrogenase YagR molybdenum-binding subunit